MSRDEMIAKLRQARGLVAEVYGGCDYPQLQMTMRQADMNLHWALWNLGEVESLTPDTAAAAET